VCSDFKSNCRIRMVLAKLAESGTIIGDRKLVQDHSVLVSDADMVFPVTEVDADIRFELLTRVFVF